MNKMSLTVYPRHETEFIVLRIHLNILGTDHYKSDRGEGKAKNKIMQGRVTEKKKSHRAE